MKIQHFLTGHSFHGLLGKYTFIFSISQIRREEYLGSSALNTQPTSSP